MPTDRTAPFNDLSRTVATYMNNEDTLMANINAYNNAYVNYLLCVEPTNQLFTSASTPPASVCNSAFSQNVVSSNIRQGVQSLPSYTPNATHPVFTNGYFDSSGNLSSVGASGTQPRTFATKIQYYASTATSLAAYIASKTNASSNTNSANIDASYNSIKAQRANLDQQIQSLYNIQDSYASYAGQNVDATIYAGIIWTILATSAIYYVFTKL